MPEEVKALIVLLYMKIKFHFFRKRVPSRSDTYSVFINKSFRFTMDCR